MKAQQKPTSKVRDLEDTGSRLGSSSLQFRRMNLDEPVLIEVVSEELTDGRLESEDGLVGRCLVVSMNHRAIIRVNGGHPWTMFHGVTPRKDAGSRRDQAGLTRKSITLLSKRVGKLTREYCKLGSVSACQSPKSAVVSYGYAGDSRPTTHLGKVRLGSRSVVHREWEYSSLDAGVNLR
jgi:hypothetical protein